MPESEDLERLLCILANSVCLPLGPDTSENSYVKIDLSVENQYLQGLDMADPGTCQKYLDEILTSSNGRVGFGGYLEQRNLYDSNFLFADGTDGRRDIHLGMDFWVAAGTKVLAPLEGELLFAGNNSEKGDYGPVLILRHDTGSDCFFTLYGHLSVASLKGLRPGQQFGRGQTIGWLGTPEENGGYAPHLHFQVIGDLEGLAGDYPGVCSETAVSYYKKNCPDPNLLFQL